ncbi:sphinganine hydroxylase Sur2, putative [Cordyceps militaris CM01]|uniref:Sphinganine hydroxylase Sur2, putative n=1 Tax=Cordyceps militaris (strain CM01) TaxID=983644 RepID=G3J665_CORMM|nr:sphinganine hydroxylase Sur2, putative [Cordyceps militaris CM01]EGX96964.1 sphinganine hydroxylase Sur2, putative [Cordyceps militaris CM01]
MVNATSASLSLAASMANNKTLFDTALPPLPAYSLSPRPDFFPWLPDFWLSLVAPVIVYWVMSLGFHLVDTLDLFPQYRLHTPEEITSRNHASRYEVARDVVVQQLIQVVTGAALQLADPPEYIGKDGYDVAVWATRVRLAQRAVPGLLGLVGLNATAIAKNMAPAHPFLAGALAGGYYPFLKTDAQVPVFAHWELALAQLIYYFLVPALQFFVAVFILDTWQYFLHRLMHINRWLYTTFHSRHHRLYVPYAYGALYNHPFEGFLLDTLGAGIGFKVTGMTTLQGTCFFTFSTMKTIDDHCGYAFPWDPLQLITNNNAAYHDIHHQTWGIKTNFSQPFFTFWDGILNTKYKGARADRLADKKRTAEKTAAK